MSVILWSYTLTGLSGCMKVKELITALSHHDPDAIVFMVSHFVSDTICNVQAGVDEYKGELRKVVDLIGASFPPDMAKVMDEDKRKDWEDVYGF
jgi:hypothetical protein